MQFMFCLASQTIGILVTRLTRAVLGVLLVLRVEVMNGISHDVLRVHCFL